MKKLFILPLAMLVLYSCGGGASKVEEEKPAVEDFSNIAKGVSGNDEHNAQNSLDYEGTYVGTLPTASGEGMKVVITLGKDTFTKTTSYIGKSDKPIEEKGSYQWNAAGNTVTLQGISAPNQYFVGENTLTQLDIDGNRIDGELADNYVLRKD